MRRALIPTALIALIIGGFSAASVIGSGDPPQPHGVLEPGGLAGVPGSDSLDHVKRDPKGRGPD